MNQTIWEQFKQISPEEQTILNGQTSVDKTLYMHDQGNTINSKKLLQDGKLITIRPHTRFIHFPEHTHDYVEIVYMCCGTTTHIVNGNTIVLKSGDLLFMNQKATHEIMEATIDDIAINFVVLPEFFYTPLAFLSEEKSPLRHFLDDCLCEDSVDSGYLHFEVSNVHTIQNLVELLISTLTGNTYTKRTSSQLTMALLFMQLLEKTDKLTSIAQEDSAIWETLRYIEEHYIDGSFSQLCKLLHYDASLLSRKLKRKTGRTYTQLVQDKRLSQASYLLKNTKMNAAEISRAVGYENVSYFYRIFTDTFKMSPKEYRKQT